jgi:hypothetical protein
VYFRVFDVLNQALIEYFAVFPALHPYMWGANMSAAGDVGWDMITCRLTAL